MIATLFIFCDIIKFTNFLYTSLQAARLNWCDTPRVLNTLKDNLQAKIENPAHPPTSYFPWVQEFIYIARKSSGGRYQLRSYAHFELSDFHVNFVKPVISNLIGEIETAFDILEHLVGFSAIDPQAMPSDVIALEKFGEQEIKSLACFYGSSSLISHGEISVKPIVNATSLEAQFNIFKKIVAAKRLKYESNQSSALAETNKKISDGEWEIELLQSVLTKTKIAKKKQRIASLEKERGNLIQKQNYNFEIMLKDWYTDNKLVSMHQDITKIIEMAGLIPPSTAELERSFSLMNLISTPLCKGLWAENLDHCMRICKFPRSLTKNDFSPILMAGRCWNWIKKSPNWSLFIEQKKELLVFVYSFLFVFDTLEEKNKDIVLIFFYFMHINPLPISSFFSRVLNFWSQGISWNTKAMF